MLKKSLLIILIFTLFYSCKNKNSPTTQPEILIAKGGVRYGGTFEFMANERVSSLFPLMTTDIYTSRIASQLFEGLVTLSPSGTDVMPAIAKKTTVNDSSTVFTFHLRNDVFFHDDPCFENGKGRKVNAHDFKYTLEFACSNDSLNKLSYLLKNKIDGAPEYYSGKADHVSGIVVKNDSTLVIKLQHPFSGFQKVLTHVGLSVFPKEAVEKYGKEIVHHPVGTGAFILSSFDTDRIVLIANKKKYWKKDEFGNPLPFLDSVVMTYSKDKTDELFSFREEKIDLVFNIPVEEVKNVLGSLQEAKEGKNIKHHVNSLSSLSITYFAFAVQSNLFSDKRIRKAFNLAIDRKKLIISQLEGEGYPALYGIVPHMENYPYQQVEGYTFDVEKARRLLAGAGYPNGTGFPPLTLYINAKKGAERHLLARAVVEALKTNLNVSIDIQLVSLKKRDELIKSKKAIFWGAGWIADYPDPENFLNLFYGGNQMNESDVINPFEYENKSFDELFEQSLKTADDKKRMQLLAKCDQLLVNDAVIMPLKTDDYITIVNSKVRNFATNEMEQLNLSQVYIKKFPQQ